MHKNVHAVVNHMQIFVCNYILADMHLHLVMELNVCNLKVKKNGYIGIHDYIFHDYIWGLTSGDNNWDVVTYGVIEAVNTFLKENSNYEVSHFALEPHMYNTIVLRRN